MKKKQTIIIIGVLLIGLVFLGAALAAGIGNGPDSEFRHQRPHVKDGLDPLTHYMQQNLVVAVLSDMSGQPSETVRQKMRDQRMRGFLEEYNIDRPAFRAAMQAKVNALVQNLTAAGFITPEQAKDFNDGMERRTERRQLMNRLIEKGLEDGTITPQQAQLLQHKRFKN